MLQVLFQNLIVTDIERRQRVGAYKPCYKNCIDNRIQPHEQHHYNFREGDKADTGHRKTIKSLGFAEAELLVASKCGKPSITRCTSSIHAGMSASVA